MLSDPSRSSLAGSRKGPRNHSVTGIRKPFFRRVRTDCGRRGPNASRTIRLVTPPLIRQLSGKVLANSASRTSMNGARASIEAAIVIMSIRSSRLSGSQDVWSKCSTRRRGVLPGAGLKGRASGWRKTAGPVQTLSRSAGVIAPNHEIIRSSNRRVLIALAGDPQPPGRRGSRRCRRQQGMSCDRQQSRSGKAAKMPLDEMLRIASEHLVRPLARQDDLHVFRRLHRHHVDRQIGGFRDRRAAVTTEHRQQGGQVVRHEFERMYGSCRSDGRFRRRQVNSEAGSSRKPMEKVRIFGAPRWASVATIAAESSPPDRKAPSGTSALRRSFTASSKTSRKAAIGSAGGVRSLRCLFRRGPVALRRHLSGLPRQIASRLAACECRGKR